MNAMLRRYVGQSLFRIVQGPNIRFKLALPDVKYEYFDFHMECKKMRWDRISLLLENIGEELEEQGYFAQVSTNPTPVHMQAGVIRTNCMDNLDRTNVVQATIAKWTLNKQLIEAGVLSPGAGVDDFENLSKDFRESASFSALAGKIR